MMILPRVRSASRLAALFSAAFAGLLLSVGTTGCGGGSKKDDDPIRTGTNGRLQAVRIGPTPGSVFISKASTFQIEWPANDPPPAEFTVELDRYREARGEEPREIVVQPVTVTRQGSSGYVWNIRRRDNFDLDGGGVYFLKLQSPGGQQVLATYIASNDRSSAAATRSDTEFPGTNGTLGGVNLLPAPGSTFIPKNTTFQLGWSEQTPPPSEFNVQLRRYKEARGTEGSSNTEQEVNADRIENTFTWNVRRRNDFALEENGVYYLEISAPGQGLYRAAFIVSRDL